MSTARSLVPIRPASGLFAMALVACFVSAQPSSASALDAARQSPPNFVFILVDDLGATDLGCTGSTFYETPHIDKLASQGMRFTQAYSACTVCSPTRAAVMTGKYPARLHITDWIAGHKRPTARLKVPDWTMHLPHEEVSLAEALAPAGYVSASIGKWHLGGPEFRPESQGFALNVAGSDKGQPPSYFSPYRISTISDGPAGEYLTDREADVAIEFVEASRDKPFLLYWPRHAVHTPLQAKPELIEKYRRKAEQHPGPQNNPTYAAMIESLDDSVGRLLSALEKFGLADRTVIFFTSDNGGLTIQKNGPTSNLGLRAGKGSTYEGGTRVPLIVRWPGTVAPGSTCGVPMMSIDYLPTMVEIAEVSRPAAPSPPTPLPRRGNGSVDGVSLVPLLKQSGTFTRETLYWHYPHYHPGGATPYGAIRQGDWKLIEFYENDRHELFNLKDDPEEKQNLANQMTPRVAELAAKLDAWRKEVGAQMPSSNNDWDGQLPAALIVSAANGSITLHARDVETHGTSVRYEPQPYKNTVGYWTKADDWVSWDFQVTEAGTFSVEILQGCGKGSGGSEVDFVVGNQSLKVVVQDTGGFQEFVRREIGQLRFEKPGRYTLSVRPKTKPGVAVMDLRQVVLTKK